MSQASRGGVCVSLVVLTGVLGWTQAVRAASGSWTGAESGLWTNSANWSVAPYAGAAPGETATFDGGGNGNTTVDLAGLTSLSRLTFDTASAAAYTFGVGAVNAQALMLESSAVVAVSNTVSANQTIHAALLLGTNTAAGTYVITNNSIEGVLTLAGNVMGAASGGTAGTKTLSLTGNGRIVLSGTLSNGGATGITLNSYGTNTLSGNNTFTGNISVLDGTLRLMHSNALGSGNKTITAANNVNGRNPSIVLDGSAGDLTIPANVTFNTSQSRAGAVINEAGNNTILGNFTLTGGDGATHIWSKGGKLTIAGNLTPNQPDRQLFLRGDADGEILGVITNGLTVTGLKVNRDVGNGTWTLCGTNTYTGATSISAGTLAVSGAGGTIASSPLVAVSGNACLRLSNSAAANHADRLNDTGAITLSGATLEFDNDGSGASFSETAGTVTVTGSNTLSCTAAAAGFTSTLTLSGLVRTGFATLNVVGDGLGQSDRNRLFIGGQADGPIGAWATVNGAFPAFYSSSRGVYAEDRTDIAAKGDTVPNGASNVVISTEGTTGPNALSDTVTAIGALIQGSAYPSVLNTAEKTLRAGTLAIASGQASLTLGVAANDGAVTPAAAGGALNLVNLAPESLLTVNAVLADHSTASSLVKAGPGEALLAATNTFSGVVTVDQGALRLAESLALQYALLGSTGTVFDSSVSSRAFTFGNLTNSFPLALVDSAADPVRLTVGNNGASSTFGGALSGAGSLVKTGSGTLTLSGSSTFSGGTTVSGGALATGVAGGLGTGPVTNDATLNLTGGAVTYTALGTALFGSGTNNVTLGTGTAQTALNGDFSAFTGLWNIGVSGTGGRAQMNGADHALATVNVLTNATLLVSQPVTHNATAFLHGGDTGESLGQLRVEGFADWAGPVKLVNSVTGSGDGFFGANSGTGTISGVISDIGGAHPVNKVGGGTVILAADGNTYAGQTWVRAGTLGATTLANAGLPSSFGQPTGAEATIKLGNGSTSARLSYFGDGDSTDRAIDLAGTTGSAYLNHSGTGLLRFTGNASYSGAGGKTLVLEGSTDGVGELAGVFSDGLPYTNKLTKTGTGKWVLSNANTYRGDTEVQNGVLSLTVPNALPATSQLRFTSLNGILSLDHDGAGAPELNMTIGVGSSGTIAAGAGAGGAAVTHAFRDFSLSLVTLTVVRASSVLSGAPGVSVKTISLSGGNAYTTTLKPLDADLQVGAASITAFDHNKVLRLDGTSGGNTVTGVIANGLSVPTLSVRKENASTWTLQGSNTFSGSTTVGGGALVVTGERGGLGGTSAITLNEGGTLIVSNTAALNHPNRLRDAAALALNGGIFDYSHSGGAANFDETVGAVTLGAGSTSTVRVSRADSGQTSTLTLAALSGGPTARVRFVGEGLGLDTRNRILIQGQSEGLIGLWARCNSDSPALYSAALGVYDGQFTDSEIAARGPSSVIPDSASANVRITTPGDTGPITLAAAPVTRAGLLQQSTDTAATVDTAGLTLATQGLAINEGQESLTLGSAAGDGALTALGGSVSLVNDSTSLLTVNAAVSNTAGAVALVKSGVGEAVLAGPLTYTGDTLVKEGTLNFGAHVYPQTLASALGGSGTLVKSGTNELHLMGASTFTGPVYINAGIVRPDQNSAFGTSAGGVFVADGATLDVGCSPDVGGTRNNNSLNMGAEVFTLTGAGVGGLGALVNTSTGSQNSAVSKVVLAGPTTVGGTQPGGRLDIRNNTPTLTMNDFTLTKSGPNTFGITSATVTPGAGHINVQQGILRLETSTRLNGGDTNVLSVASGAELELYNTSNPQYWHLALSGGSVFDAANNSDATTRNRWAGPLTLNGAVTLTGGSGFVANLLGDIGGAGSLNKTGSANITISGTNNTFTGSTTISAGTLTVSNLCNVGTPCSLGTPTTVADGTIKIGSGTTSATLAYSGLGDTSDRVIDLAGTSGGATLTQSGNGTLTLTAGVSASVSGSKTLTLRGNSAAPAEISGPIVNPASGRVAISKNDSGTWTLSGNNSYTGDISVSNGRLVLSGPNAQGLGAVLVGSAAADARLYLDSGCQLTSISTRQRAGGIMIGTDGGAHGALYVSAGATVNRTPGTGDDQAFTIGKNGGSYGYFHMSGGDFRITRIQTGLSGTASTSNTVGNVRITGGTLTLPDYMLLGRGKGSLSAFTVAGGTVSHTNAGNHLSLGYEGGRAELNLTGGTLESYGRNLTVRQSAESPTGIVNLCAGLLSVDLLQNTAPGVAFLNFAGGTLKAGNVNSAAFIPTTFNGVYSYGPFGGFAGGAVIDSAGRAITLPAPLRAPAGQGVYGIALSDKGSGFIGEPYVSLQGGEGVGATAIANMEDDESGNGTLRVASITVTCPGTGYTAAPAVLFIGGGRAAVAPTVGALTLSANTSGGLTKLGDGTLTLSVANTYTGTTTVAGGTLKLTHPAALPTGTPVVLAGGTLDFGSYTLTNTLSGSGTLIGGTLQVVLSPAGEGVTGTDTLSLNAGTLQGTYLADATASGSCDRVNIQGNINLSAFALQIVSPELLNPVKRYTLLSCTGTRTGTFSSANLPVFWKLIYRANGEVELAYREGTMLRIR